MISNNSGNLESQNIKLTQDWNQVFDVLQVYHKFTIANDKTVLMMIN